MNTEIPPALAVISGSMCIPYDGACDGWTHPFDQTLHIGDLIIIQGVNPQTLNTNYPNSDIIVFHRPDLPADDENSKIVHRIVSKIEVNGKLYFYTKGDGNSVYKWPDPPESTDYWRPDSTDLTSTYNGAISQDYIYGKVIMRIPWIGLVIIKMYEVGVTGNSILVPLLVLLIILIIIIEFVIPLLQTRNTKDTKKGTYQKNNQT
ncbi:MAG: hypothetical protein NWF05_02815 [Candidatus Bathyarchaeota archaeon]|nr:hypothetical protein [Candidatus Bathyarchaeota archaeon]